MKYLSALFFCLTITGSIMACGLDGGFVPENDLRIPVDAKRSGGLTEAQFNSVIDKLEVIYAPIVSEMGGKLKIKRLWTNDKANASAIRGIFWGKNWVVNMYGGLARHDSITEDGFALVLCHELGHHLGGTPKYSGVLGIGERFAASEGQADYFATLKCLRKAFLNDNNKEIISRMDVPATLASSCAKAWPNQADYSICVRSGMAGVSVSGFFSSMRRIPAARFETPDPKVVKKNFHKHPEPQCRLDTYFQGALCEKSFNDDVSQEDEVLNTCHVTSGHKVGVRPFCWNKPKA